MKFAFFALALAATLANISAMKAEIKLETKAVPYQDGATRLEGYLAFDPAKTGAGARPGVIVVPEWWGVNEYAKERARQLAELGYVAFVVDMYGAGKVTTDAKQAGEWAGQFYGKPLMASRARAGLDQLLATKLVDPAKVASIGYCFGGSTSLALAFSGAPLAGIVSFHGGLIPVPAEAAAKTHAKFLICHGAVDPTIKPEALATFQKGMDEAKFDYQFISYSGALHAFTNPDADEMAAKNDMKGVIGYNAAADHRSFAAMVTFFKELFGE